jgi:hypothetical protein
VTYQTNAKLLGLPLVQIKFGDRKGGVAKWGVARAWIAVGDISYGVLLSIGGIAFGGIAVGGLAVGLLSFAGLAIGGLAWGGAAIGFVAVGGLALAWNAAWGGLASARLFAVGGEVVARHANDPAAEGLFRHPLLSWTVALATNLRWLYWVGVVLCTGLIYSVARLAQRKKPDPETARPGA